MKAIVCTLSMFVFGAVNAHAWSVWDDAKVNAASFEGKIKSIAVEGDVITVKIAAKTGKKSEQVESFNVCSEFKGGDNQNLTESTRAELLRDAFNRGETVKVSYGGPWSRCISSVTIKI